MPATSFYADADAAYDTQKSRQDLEPEITADDADVPADEGLRTTGDNFCRNRKSEC